MVLGYIHHMRREFSLARRHLDRAFSLNPNEADGLAVRALLLTFEGEPAEGIVCAEAAIRLNPHHPDWYLGALAAGHFFTRNFREAIRVREMIARGFPEHWASLAAAYAHAGDVDKARNYLSDFLQQAPSYWRERPTGRLIIDMFALKRQEDIDLYLDGLRKAGLHE
jgi:tetratricopeptide (TPR) repeat protein